MPELDLGNVKGPQGKSAYQSALDAGYSGSEEAFNTAMAKAPDAVLYTAQNLTDEQKAQARTNINAAPGGFGLGGAAKMLTEADNVDSIRESGWYTWDWDPSKQPAGLPEEAKYHTGNMRVDGTTGGNYTAQTIYLAKNGSSVNVGDECVIQRLRATAPWEWVNPPMILGTEYCTTERYLGKPVYVKTFNIPTSVFTNQGVGYAHGIANLDRIVDSFVCCRADYIRIFPWSYYASAEWSAQYILNSSTIKFELGASALERIKAYTNGVDVTLKYTKTID